MMSAANGQPFSERERHLIAAAAAMVHDWLLDPNRAPFRRALLAQAEAYLEPKGLSRTDYPDFRLLANAIRVGRGHPTANPGPLLAILRGSIHHRVSGE